MPPDQVPSGGCTTSSRDPGASRSTRSSSGPWLPTVGGMTTPSGAPIGEVSRKKLKTSSCGIARPPSTASSRSPLQMDERLWEHNLERAQHSGSTARTPETRPGGRYGFSQGRLLVPPLLTGRGELRHGQSGAPGCPHRPVRVAPLAGGGPTTNSCLDGPQEPDLHPGRQEVASHPFFPSQETEAAVPSVRAHLRRCRRVWKVARDSMLQSRDRVQRVANRTEGAGPSLPSGPKGVAASQGSPSPGSLP